MTQNRTVGPRPLHLIRDVGVVLAIAVAIFFGNTLLHVPEADVERPDAVVKLEREVAPLPTYVPIEGTEAADRVDDSRPIPETVVPRDETLAGDYPGQATILPVIDGVRAVTVVRPLDADSVAIEIVDGDNKTVEAQQVHGDAVLRFSDLPAGDYRLVITWNSAQAEAGGVAMSNAGAAMSASFTHGAGDELVIDPIGGR